MSNETTAAMPGQGEPCNPRDAIPWPRNVTQGPSPQGNPRVLHIRTMLHVILGIEKPRMDPRAANHGPRLDKA